MEKKVTIIVPIYNSEQTLERCVDSLCRQDYRDLEILLIDNNSTDNSNKICESYARKDNRVRVLFEKKQGAGAARNRGLREGTGDILCFADSDDELICNTAISEIVAKSEFGGLVWYDFCNEVPDRKRGRSLFLQNNDTIAVTSLLEQSEENDLDSVIAVVWNKAFDYDVVRKNKIFFPEDRKQGEDFSFVVQYLTKISEVQFIHNIFYKKYEPHLTVMQTNAYDFLPLTQDYIGDITRYLLPLENYVKAYITMAKHLSSKAVIAVIRIHHPNATLSKGQCKRELRQLLHSDVFREVFKKYRPGKGQSKTLPFCMRRGWIAPVYLLGKHRAKKAYGQK